MNKLLGKVALITGGTSGIGLAAAKLFFAEGARVFITGKNETSLAQARAVLPNDVIILKSDASKLSDIDELLANIQSHTKKIDILFLNAGIAVMKPFEATNEEDYDNMLSINLKGPFFTVQKALPLLSHGASIILTASIAGHKGNAMMAAYSASKAGVKSLGATLGAYLAERNIRVNTISPGPISTPIFDKAGLPQEMLDGLTQSINQSVPMHRFGNPQEIAKVALFLASDDSTYMTGADIVVDGGFLAA